MLLEAGDGAPPCCLLRSGLVAVFDGRVLLPSGVGGGGACTSGGGWLRSANERRAEVLEDDLWDVRQEGAVREATLRQEMEGAIETVKADVRLELEVTRISGGAARYGPPPETWLAQSLECAQAQATLVDSSAAMGALTDQWSAWSQQQESRAARLRRD